MSVSRRLCPSLNKDAIAAAVLEHVMKGEQKQHSDAYYWRMRHPGHVDSYKSHVEVPVCYNIHTCTFLLAILHNSLGDMRNKTFSQFCQRDHSCIILENTAQCLNALHFLNKSCMSSGSCEGIHFWYNDITKLFLEVQN